MNKKLIILIIFILIVATGFTYFYFQYFQRMPPQQDIKQTELNQIVQSLIPAGSDISLEVVRIEEGSRGPLVSIKTKIDWIEFANKFLMDTLQDEQGLRNELRDNLYLDFLAKQILSKQEVNNILDSCNKELEATVQSLRVPFYNNFTGIHFDPTGEKLLIEANATIDAQNNKCVRGIVDLHSGKLRCLDNACYVY